MNSLPDGSVWIKHGALNGLLRTRVPKSSVKTEIVSLGPAPVPVKITENQ